MNNELEKLQGLECPVCGCRHFTTNHTRRIQKRITRYKTCRHCGRRIVTVEKIEEKHVEK